MYLYYNKPYVGVTGMLGANCIEFICIMYLHEIYGMKFTLFLIFIFHIIHLSKIKYKENDIFLTLFFFNFYTVFLFITFFFKQSVKLYPHFKNLCMKNILYVYFLINIKDHCNNGLFRGHHRCSAFYHNNPILICTSCF